MYRFTGVKVRADIVMVIATSFVVLKQVHTPNTGVSERYAFLSGSRRALPSDFLPLERARVYTQFICCLNFLSDLRLASHLVRGSTK